jgi:hypothetical protein
LQFYSLYKGESAIGILVEIGPTTSFLGTVPERKWQKKQHCVQYQFYPHLQEGLESGEQLGLLKLFPIPLLKATHPPTSPKRMKRVSSEKE